MKTKVEVVRLVGFPPGDYRTAADDNANWKGFRVAAHAEGLLLGLHSDEPHLPLPAERWVECWITDFDQLFIVLDSEGNVTGSVFRTFTSDDTFITWLRRKLKV